MTNSRLVKRLVSLVINYKKHRGLSKLDTVEQKGEYQVFSHNTMLPWYHGSMSRYYHILLSTTSTYYRYDVYRYKFLK